MAAMKFFPDLVLAFLAGFIAYTIITNPSYGTVAHTKRLLLAAEQVAEAKRIAVCTNAAVDLIVPATSLFTALGINGPDGADRDLSVLQQTDDLAAAFLFFFKKGAAAERTFLNATAFKSIVDVALTLPDIKLFTGGNAALMGEYLAHRGVQDNGPLHQVSLVAHAGPQLQTLLHPRINVPESCKKDTDEYHLILEYHRGDTWSGETAPKSNRFIFSYDKTNADLAAMHDASAFLKQHDDLDVLVVSGLHMLDAALTNVTSRMKEVESVVRSAQRPVVHLELASIADGALMKDITAHVLRNVDSLGLNEQELIFLATTHNAMQGAQQWDTSSSLCPDVPLVADLLHWVLPSLAAGSRLSRVHFHCLTYHIVATRQGLWLPSEGSVVAGSLACARRACASPELEPELYNIEMPSEFALSFEDSALSQTIVQTNSSATHTWERKDVTYSLAAVLVCKRPVKTVGLGDTISAAGIELATKIA